MYRLTLLVAIAMSTIVTTPSHGYDRTTGQPFASRSEVIAANGMAATSQPLATQAALEILRQGGNAIDAAIAANAVLGLVEPTGCGIGGDLFAIVWDAKERELTGLNASGRSPKSLTLGHFQERGLDEIPYLGPLSVSTPGAVDGWFELHERYGSLSMADILAPAIRYAENGFPVTEVIAAGWAANARTRREYPGFAETFLPGGEAPKKGQLFKNPDLAKTYRAVAEGGRDAFYKGQIAETIGEYMAENGGFLSYDDMAEHQSNWVDPVSTTYRGVELFELPPNTQGIAALQLLNILEGYDLAAMGVRQCRLRAHVCGSEKDCVRRSREVLRRHGFRRRTDRAADLERVCRRTAQADRSEPCCRRGRRRRCGVGARRHDLYDGCGR